MVFLIANKDLSTNILNESMDSLFNTFHVSSDQIDEKQKIISSNNVKEKFLSFWYAKDENKVKELDEDRIQELIKKTPLDELPSFFAALAKLAIIKSPKEDSQNIIIYYLKRLYNVLNKSEGLDQEIYSKIFNQLFKDDPASLLDTSKIIDKLYGCIYRGKNLNEIDDIKLTKEDANRGIEDFTRDGRRCGSTNNFASIDVNKNKELISYTLVQRIDEEKWTNYHVPQLNTELHNFLKNKDILDNDIEVFKSLIFYIFSQFSDNYLFNMVKLELENAEEQTLNDLQFLPDLKKEDIDTNFSKNIHIIDNDTLKFEMNIKDPKKVFSVKKIDFINGPEDHGIKIKDIRLNFTFKLSENKITDGRVLFVIDSLY